ncbi:MAG: 5-formyltetrahydrofolate cyclo-ligase [Inquilinus sp.]|nr:5-formyltetrahydrofolate cyclo-ligase [Inquilinus sp.]
MDAAKRALRREAQACRAEAHARDGATAGPLLRDRFLAAIEPPAGAVVSGFVPIRDEIDVMPLLAALAERGHPCALPVVAGPRQPLDFLAWAPGDPLRPGPFDVPIPAPTAARRRPELLLVPMLAFDGRGRRIGYGAGFYDATLALLRRDGPVLAVGVAFAGQQVDAIPVEPHDQPLDWIVTERSAWRVER